MKIADLTLYGSNAPLSTASPLPTAVEHASIAGYEYTAPQQVNTFTSGYENILDMGSCTGFDDAEAAIRIVKERNENITGLTAYGRNYAGNWAGAPNPAWLEHYWRTLTEPMGLVKYAQDSNGNIVKAGIIRHPAGEFMVDANSNRVYDIQNRLNYMNAGRSPLNNPVQKFINELNEHLAKRERQ